ncbi:MAG: CBS domain-containing protein [Pirellulaceae bacterium]|nr:CBS domain-containing protein [Pirellulaceae bacterium]
MHSRWRNLATSPRGSAIPEYALLVGILVASVGLACLTAVSSVDRTFSVAAQFSGAAGEEAPSATTNVGNNTARGRAELLNPIVLQQQRIATVLAAGLGIVVFGITLASGVGVLRLIRTRPPRPDSPQGGIPTTAPAPQPSMHEQLMEKRQQIRHILSHDLEHAAGFDTQVQHLMSKRLSVVHPDMAVADAVATMEDKRIRHLLVCGEDGTLQGILSDRDIKQRSGTLVRDIMTGAPVTVPPDTSMGPAITLMLQRSISCLPVVREGAVLGVLTTTDILLSCQCLMQVLERVAAGLYGRPEGDTLLREPW